MLSVQVRHGMVARWRPRARSAGALLVFGLASLLGGEATAEEQEPRGAVSGFLRAITRAFVPEAEFEVPVAIGVEEAPADKPGVVADIGTHRQTRRIDVVDADGHLRLTSFCLNPEGHIVALLGQGDSHVAAVDLIQTLAGKKSDKLSEIQILDDQGSVLRRFSLDFSGSAVNVAADGTIYVGGNGVVAKFDANGKQLLRAQAPHLVGLAQDDAALEVRARETMAETASSLKEALAALEQQKKDLEAKADDELTEEERQSQLMMEPMLTAYRSMIEQQTDPEKQKADLQQTMESLSSRQRTINAVSVSDKYVFVTCAASKGYGYSVWRTDLNFENGEQIVDGLRGCCGQMDVQCCEDELIVAENARHRVVQFDAQGKETKKFGKRSRDGEGVGFGSCCNPMNTRLVGDQLYVSESDGTVKRFDRAGKFIEVVGKASVQPGCKSSIVAANASGDRVYYFDVMNSGICVLERKPNDIDAQASVVQP